MSTKDTGPEPGRRKLYLRIAREDHYGGGESASVRAQHEASRRLAAEMGFQFDLEDFTDPDTPAGQTGGDAL